MKRARIIIAAMILTLLTTALAYAAENGKKDDSPKKPEVLQQLPDPAARVNGVPISAADLKNAFKALQAGQGNVPPEKMKDAQIFVLNQLVSGELMYQISKETQVEDMEKKQSEAISRLKSRFKTEDDFRKGLGSQGLTERQLRELIRRNIVIENHIEKNIASKVLVTEADAKSFYDKNPEKFILPEQARASHILVTVDAKASEDDRKKARAKAEELLKQVKEGGADFAKTARESSSCPSSKNGGDLGYFSKGQMVKPFEDAVWSMKPGELSGIVETQFGFHIIKLSEKRGADKIPFEPIKAKIIENLKQQRILASVNAALEAETKKAKIEIYLK